MITTIIAMTQGLHRFVTSDCLRQNGNCLSLPAITALPGILTFEIEIFYLLNCNDLCLKGKLTEHKFQQSRPLCQKIFLFYLLPPL